MKKVLILAYDFPPYVSAGALRPYSWYKYFYEFDLYPVVVTRQWSNKYGNYLDYVASSESETKVIEENIYGILIKTKYKPNLSNRLLLKFGEKRFRIIRKLISGYYEIMQFVFFVGPKSELYYSAKEYLKANRIDCIIATGEPFVLFKYASKLSSIYKIPWIADYRDPWSQNKSRRRNFIIKKTDIFFEQKFISNVVCATTVSEYVKCTIQQLIKKLKIEIIPNGFDLNLNSKKTSTKKSKTLSIAFAGTIYDWHPWRSFLKVCNDIYKESIENVDIAFIGVNRQNDIELFFDKEQLNNLKLTFISKLPNNELYNELQKHDLLLLFNDYNILGTKIYDYLAASRLILLCYTKDNEAIYLRNKFYSDLNNNILVSDRLQEQMILETQSGIAIKDEGHLKRVIKELSDELKLYGEIKCDPTGIEKFTRKRQTEKLADIVKTILSES